MVDAMKFSVRTLLGASALCLSFAASPLLAQTLFTKTSDGFVGNVSATAAVQGAALHAGDQATIKGTGLIAGQKITLMRGTNVLNADAPLVVDAQGDFSFNLTLDAEALTGLQPIVVIAEGPDAAKVIDMKVSPKLALTGEDLFAVKSEKVVRGLYQVAYSKKSDAVFVAAAVGRPPVRDSELVRLNPETLAIEARVTPATAPGRGPQADDKDQRPPVFAVYGLDVDDAAGTVWVTNTRQNTVAVYNQADLSLIKQFEPELVSHSRDVLVDETRSRAYVSSAFTGDIYVFDTKTNEHLDTITIQSAVRGKEFGAMSLDLDEAAGKLFTVSMTSEEAAVIDLASSEVRLIPLPGAIKASGVSYDPQEGLIFVASQDSDNLLILNEATGEVLHDVEVGAGALNVAFDPISRLAYVANRGSGTLTVVNSVGEIIANIDGGTMPNQIKPDGQGNIWAVNKSRGSEDPSGDRLWKITPVAK